MATHYKHKAIVFLLAAFLCYSKVNGQADVTLNGLGRGILTNNKLSGGILENDTTSRRKGLSGYNLFDLSLGFSKGREFNSNVILRVKQPYGEFWGEETKFEFRQLQVMGDLKNISYALGDIDVEMTPYTVFNFHELQNYHGMESEIYKTRRDIVQYENFINGNVWRLQGVKLGSALFLNNGKLIEQLQVKAFGVRTNVTDDVAIPDRVLSGISFHAVSEDHLKLGVNYVGYMDIQLNDFETDYRNNVVTGDLNYRIINKDGFKLNVKGEGGISDYDFYKKSVDSTVSANDYFYDAGIIIEIKNGITFGLSYKNVGVKFSSPSSQTRRINENTNPLLFSKVLNNTTNREQILFDRFTQEQIYNRGISPVLQSYIPYYNNVNPYGEATPNRTGFTFDASTRDTSAVKLIAQARYFNEVVGEGSSEKRNFIAASSGVRVGFNKLFNFKKTLALTLGGRVEKTDREDGAVDLSSTLLDAGIIYGITPSLDLLAGMKYLSASGKEIVAIRNEVNNISSYYGLNVDIAQQIVSFGFRVNFNETTNFSLNYNWVTQENKLNNNFNYNIDQLFLNFNIMF